MTELKFIRISRFVVIGSLTALIITLTLANLFNSPLNLTRWIIQIFPLLAFIPALLGPGLRPYQWLCFVIMLYFMMGVLMAFSPGQQIIGFMITFFCALLFCSAIFYIHQQQKIQKRNNQIAKS
tara:strand:- start:384 stop:755 length:372 start_codon:yes stop_codon:yes gene_type:complete